jgi:hypothetical protein
VNLALFDVTAEMFRVDVPVFVTVTLSILLWPTTTLPNAFDAGLTDHPGATPVPVTVTVSGEPVASWVKSISPACAPVAAGLNVI